MVHNNLKQCSSEMTHYIRFKVIVAYQNWSIRQPSDREHHLYYGTYLCAFMCICVFRKSLIRLVVVLYDREGTSGKPWRAVLATGGSHWSCLRQTADPGCGFNICASEVILWPPSWPSTLSLAGRWQSLVLLETNSWSCLWSCGLDTCASVVIIKTIIIESWWQSLVLAETNLL